MASLPIPIPKPKLDTRYLNFFGIRRFIEFLKVPTHLFDVFEILLGLVDTASDIAVAHEFYNNPNENQMPFFYAVFVVFLLGCLIDSLGFTISLRRAGKINNEEPKFFQT